MSTASPSLSNSLRPSGGGSLPVAQGTTLCTCNGKGGACTQRDEQVQEVLPKVWCSAGSTAIFCRPPGLRAQKLKSRSDQKDESTPSTKNYCTTVLLVLESVAPVRSAVLVQAPLVLAVLQ